MIEERLNTYYKATSDDNKIDFNFCHPLWQKYYITIDPPSQDYSGGYYAIGSIAAIVNLTSLLVGFHLIYKLMKQKGATDQLTDAFSESGNLKTKICSFYRFFMIFLPVLLQAFDSVLDAVYFIKLKTGNRIIHVPLYIHVLQGFLLFTCKLN